MKRQKGYSDVSALWALAIIAWVVLSWLTHVVVCLKTGSWGFLIAGAVLFPIGVIHGTGIWFGVF